MSIDQQDLEDRLRSTFERKAEQLDTMTLVPVGSASPNRRGSTGLTVALLGMAAALIIGVVIARSGREGDPTSTTDTVPLSPAEPLPGWVPAGMDVWNVSSYDQPPTFTVTLREAGSDRMIQVGVHADSPAPDLALTGVDPVQVYGPTPEGTTGLAWRDDDGFYTAIGRDLSREDLATLVRQVSLARSGDRYVPSALPTDWTMTSTVLEPASVSTTARFAYGAPDAAASDLAVTQSVAAGDGDGAGWSAMSVLQSPDADGTIWSHPPSSDDTRTIMMVDRAGQAVTVTSFGSDPLSDDALRALVDAIVAGPPDQLPLLAARAEANVAATPVIASTTTDAGEVVEVRGSQSDGPAAICLRTDSVVTCPDTAHSGLDRITATLGTDGAATIIGATRERPSFDEGELGSPPWIAESNGWFVYRVYPRGDLLSIRMWINDVEAETLTADVP